VGFENKNILFYFEKYSSLLHTMLALYVAVNSKVAGLGPGANPPIVSYNASAAKKISQARVKNKKNLLFWKTL
jgi:hypothetical protein